MTKKEKYYFLSRESGEDITEAVDNTEALVPIDDNFEALLTLTNISSYLRQIIIDNIFKIPVVEQDIVIFDVIKITFEKDKQKVISIVKYICDTYNKWTAEAAKDKITWADEPKESSKLLVKIMGVNVAE